MDSYAPLLERLRVPQPSMQRLAVISIFEKLATAPSYLNADSNPGRDAISKCLHSNSPAVVDQSVRELCRFVKDSKMDVSRALLELQSSLEGTNSRFVDVFVKGIGFVVRFGFENHSTFCMDSADTHPFVNVLSCRMEVQSELVKQVLLFTTQSKQLGVVKVCKFLRPFLSYAILRTPFSDMSLAFVMHLISLMASICCSFPVDALPIMKLLTECLKYLPLKSVKDFNDFNCIVGYIADAYTVILRHLVAAESQVIREAQLCGVELLETIFSLSTDIHKHSSGMEPINKLSKHLLLEQKDMGLSYVPELSSLLLSLFLILIQSELEHEQLSTLKLITFLVKWKNDSGTSLGRVACCVSEELLFIIPVVNLVSSPCKSVKVAATDLLVLLEKHLVNLLNSPKLELTMPGELLHVSRLEDIILRLLQHLLMQDQPSLCSTFFLRFAPGGKTDVEGMHDQPELWVTQLREYSLQIVERRKSSLPVSLSQEVFMIEMPLLLGAISGVLVLKQSVARCAIDTLAAIGTLDPKLGVSLLLATLYYNNIFSTKDIKFHDISLKLLGLLPSLASHSLMTPLVVQTILPMLSKDVKPVLYATAIRLLCKTWEINDRIFGNLQEVLQPKEFTELISDRSIRVSMAASIRDICRRNPDRGVDLILAVSACIEGQDPIVQSLGFQSLAHLCEADVIDFYTAWDVIAKHVASYSEDPIVAYGVCLLLRWGAMDAEAYLEASKSVLQILWEVGSSRQAGDGSQWVKARASAFEALTHYEVTHIENGIPDFKKRNMELLISEVNPGVLRDIEAFEVKIIAHEHVNRRRVVKERRVTGNKIEKLLDVYPRVIFSAGKEGNPGHLPGAALLCLSLTPKDVSNLQNLHELNDRYENALVEIASSLQLSRNILIALLSLQSWKAFMQRWMKAYMNFLDDKVTSTVLDKNSRVANDILKTIRRIAEAAIPRSAENMALAAGALCMVLPHSAHNIKTTASKFLLNWLFQYEHEHRQWSAAISLGLITSCLHITDHKQKFQNITGLLEVACGSKSTLVKGACGLGLGFSCQNLLTAFKIDVDGSLEEETHKMQEEESVGNIVRTLSLLIRELTLSSSNILQNLCQYFPPNSIIRGTYTASEFLPCKNSNLEEEDIWGVAGLVMGLGFSVNAIYRAGNHDSVIAIKDVLTSFFVQKNSSVSSEKSEIALSVGSCLALPAVVSFCLKVELINHKEVNHLMDVYEELISELVSLKKTGIFHQSLLMASCVGAGSLVSCILNEGAHYVEFQKVKSLFDLFRKCYSDPYSPNVHLGGMIGVVNALGAGAGNLLHDYYPLASSLQTSPAQKESSYLMGPLLANPICKPHLTLIMQEIFLVAKSSDDSQLQQYAAWAVSFLRHSLLTREPQNVDNSFQSSTAGFKSVSQTFSEDSTVMKISSWLMHLPPPGTGSIPHHNTIGTVLRCLSQAPRLPSLDWGAITRRCMRYEEAQVEQLFPSDTDRRGGTLREECVQFALAHAIHFNQLLSFLDELFDFPRFSGVELNLQSFMLFHLSELIKVFSGSRLEKLFDDISSYFSSLVSSRYSPENKSLLRLSCWKGIYQCLDEASSESLEYLSNIEKCMEVLFSLLPELNSEEEWSEAVKCLGKARRSWLMDILQVQKVDQVKGNIHSDDAVKKIKAKARLVTIGSIPLSDLGKLKAHIFNLEACGIWDALVEVVAALQHAEGSVKRQWLIEAVEISCTTSFPSTAMRFVGLLSGSCCRYMPLLTLNQFTVLSDLPVTLTSLLSDPNWETISESVASNLWISTARFYKWVRKDASLDDVSHSLPIDRSENDNAVFLMQAMHQACVSLKDKLPFERQLKLANMVVF